MYNTIAILIVNIGKVTIVVFLEEYPNCLNLLDFLQYIKFGFISSIKHIIMMYNNIELYTGFDKLIIII